jgi:RimJ/RimL family protein N-acetyltransferase
MFETDRLFIRPFNDDDVEDVYILRSNQEIMRFIREPQKFSESERWLKLISSRWKTERYGFCAVVEKAKNEFIGWCGLWYLSETDEIEVGYAISKKHWGKGYATEAAQEFLRYGFNELKLEKIVSVARAENKASVRVMEKLGMKFVTFGVFYGVELVQYRIEKGEYDRNRKTDNA